MNQTEWIAGARELAAMIEGDLAREGGPLDLPRVRELATPPALVTALGMVMATVSTVLRPSVAGEDAEERKRWVNAVALRVLGVLTDEGLDSVLSVCVLNVAATYAMYDLEKRAAAMDRLSRAVDESGCAGIVAQIQGMSREDGQGGIWG